jgi:hypothetical protein
MRRRVNRATNPLKRLQAVGTAYIDFALSQPGLFRTAFTSHPATSQDDGHDAPNRPDVESGADRAEPYEILGGVLDEAVAAGLLNADSRPGAEIAAWSAVHGLAVLLLDGPLPTTGPALEFARSRVLNLIERGLLDKTGPPA